MVRGKIILLAVGLLVLGIGIRLWFLGTPTPRPAVVSPSPAPAPPVPQEAQAPAPEPPKADAVIRRRELEAMSRGPWGRSPFLTPEEEAALQQLVVKTPETIPGFATLQVRAILISEERKVATINGHVVTEGDWVGQERVLEIRPQAVVLEKGANRRTVELQFPAVPIHVGPAPSRVR